ncbi:MAG: response regulator transcription factor [Deltaproteobacteria bacterium]|nr:response regulator transcription factor [Deltaproteobacteria bacterium]
MAGSGKFIAQNWVVYIAGQQKIKKGLLASFMEREFGLRCQVADDNQGQAPEGHVGDRYLLLLRDCSDDNADDIFRFLDIFGERLLSDEKIFLALVNLSPKLTIEAELLRRGVRGVVNSDVAPTLLVRYVKAIISGELWFSRQLISRCLLESRGHFVVAGSEIPDESVCSLSVALSGREKEVLTEIVQGSTNEQIADNLCISQHTVKSHVYRIFRKINVPNRLQAALWAVKYLT